MKIIYIHQYFKTPDEPGGTRSYWIARELIKNGHEVTMITTSSSITEHKKIKIIEGIKVIYLRIPYNQNMGLVTRFRSFFSFMIKSTVAAANEKFDLVIATSTPLSVGFPALIFKWFTKKPFIFEVRDLWPEVPIQMGAFKNPFLKGIAKSFEKIIYKEATHIIALSPGMKNGVLKYVGKEKVSMIPNMAKVDIFGYKKINYNLIKQLNLNSETFKIVHFGALGKANGAMSIIESAKLLNDNNDIEFIFIGGGATEKELQKECILHELNNVKFLGNFPMNTTAEIVNFCDVSIISFMDLPILFTNSPNKFFDSLSAGKPVIVNSAGWTKDLVEKYNCGYYVNPNDPQQLANIILKLQNSPNLTIELGIAARTLAERKFDKSILCSEFVCTLHRVFGLPKPLKIKKDTKIFISNINTIKQEEFVNISRTY